ncbi:unnamed protein product [Paramecium pentaurelia]|uniref:Uncharacterized protein n=1 Tax=Paramecium pentaurelia TaxID=43138 RepID=A0A8S1USZ2_9CILI|nr:unnamed protein product [Paramecium pentaurelia]
MMNFVFSEIEIKIEIVCIDNIDLILQQLILGLITGYIKFIVKSLLELEQRLYFIFELTENYFPLQGVLISKHLNIISSEQKYRNMRLSLVLESFLGWNYDNFNQKPLQQY